MLMKSILMFFYIEIVESAEIQRIYNDYKNFQLFANFVFDLCFR